LNKENFERRRTVRTAENIEHVRDALIENPQVSTRRNGMPMSRTI